MARTSNAPACCRDPVMRAILFFVLLSTSLTFLDSQSRSSEIALVLSTIPIHPRTFTGKFLEVCYET